MELSFTSMKEKPYMYALAGPYSQLRHLRHRRMSTASFDASIQELARNHAASPVFRCSLVENFEQLHSTGFDGEVSKDTAFTASPSFLAATTFRGAQRAKWKWNENLICTIYDATRLQFHGNGTYTFLEPPANALQAILIFDSLFHSNEAVQHLLATLQEEKIHFLWMEDN
jgi:hypothetical protein